MKEFLKSLQNDPVDILLINKRNELDFSLKTFFSWLENKFPSKLTYIRPASMKEACFDEKNEIQAQVLRKMLRRYLRKDYLSRILIKKTEKLDYLRECRVLENKILSL